MTSLVIICTVYLMAIVSSDGSPLEASDIKEILEVLRTKKENSDSSDSSSDSNDVDTRILRNRDVIELLKKRNPYMVPNQLPSDLSTDKKFGPFYGMLKNGDSLKHQILEHVLNKDLAEQRLKYRPIKPNKLLAPVHLEDTEQSGLMDNLDDYSKIFVILDPTAIQNNENKNDVERLLSNIMALSGASRGELQKKKNAQIYNRFKIKDGFLTRRNRRQIKDLYGDKSEESRPRRPIGDFGGAGGRTPIPYARIREDIYEKEH